MKRAFASLIAINLFACPAKTPPPPPPAVPAPIDAGPPHAVDAGSIAQAPAPPPAAPEPAFVPEGFTPASVAEDNSKSPFEIVPDSETVLSVLEEVGAKCRWLRFDPIAKKKTLAAEFEHCPESIAWSHDGRKALARMSDGTMQFVDIAKRTLMGSVPPSSGTFGIDSKGDAWVLTFETQNPDEHGNLHWGKQTFHVEENFGLPGLAHGWKLQKSGTWKDSEVALSSGEACDTLEEHALDVEGDFGFNTTTKLLGGPQSGTEIFSDDAVLAMLEKAAPPPAERSEDHDDESGAAWWVLPTTSFGTYVRLFYEDRRYTNDADMLGFVRNGKVEFRAVNSVTFRGDYVLTDDTLYEAGPHKIVFRSTGLFSFWPRQADQKGLNDPGGYAKRAQAWSLAQFGAGVVKPVPDAGEDEDEVGQDAN